MYIIICAALGVPWKQGGTLLRTIVDFVGYITKELYRLLEQEDFTWTQTTGKLDMHCTSSVRSPSQTESLDGNEEL